MLRVHQLDGTIIDVQWMQGIGQGVPRTEYWQTEGGRYGHEPFATRLQVWRAYGQEARRAPAGGVRP